MEEKTTIATTAPSVKEKPVSTRYWDCVFYDNPNDINVRTMIYEVFRSIAYIYHDKDVKADGTPKEPHYHVLGITAEKHGVRTVRYMLKHFPQTVECEPCYNRLGAWDYLTHKNNPEKAQYSKDGIYADAEALQRFRGLKGDNREFIEDMETLSMRDLVITYGRDVMRNYRAYREYLDLMHAQEAAVAQQPYAYTQDLAEKAAMEQARKYLVYRIDSESRRRTFLAASDVSVRDVITKVINDRRWNDLDRIEVTKEKSSSFGEYLLIFQMAYCEAKEAFEV